MYLLSCILYLVLESILSCILYLTTKVSCPPLLSSSIPDVEMHEIVPEEIILLDDSSNSCDKPSSGPNSDGESKSNVCKNDPEAEFIQSMGRGPSSSKIKAGTAEYLQFMQDFDPQKSSRNQQKKKKRYHHNDGRLVQYADDFDDCDCLRPNCVGCHMPCPSCNDTRCGSECRVSRKWIYETVEIEGSNVEFRNPHSSSFT
ncbi:ARL14 effector protein isoform X1 [Folsomia candida]|uniref:ARL14 effector protein isoform X1 n=1 Tax=Folsomia candida TaxID=158441 RepID=UPI0016054A9C|nr:ARL14 effector protein isoform X1 [Folsomia candida]